MDFLPVPPALGVLLAALIELAKAFGLVGVDDGGRWAMLGTLVISAALTFGVGLNVFDVDSEQFKALVEIAGLVGNIIMVFLASFGTHKLAKAAKLFPQHRK